MKKIIGLTSALVLMLSMVPVSGFAEEIDPKADTSPKTETVKLDDSKTPAESAEPKEVKKEDGTKTAPVNDATGEKTETTPVEEEPDAAVEKTAPAEKTATEPKDGTEPVTNEKVEQDIATEISDETAPKETVKPETPKTIIATAPADSDKKAETFAAPAPKAIPGNPYTGSFATWATQAAGDTVTNTITKDGITYDVTSTLVDDNLFFANKIKNTSTGVENTYSHANGDSSTSIPWLSADGQMFTGATYTASGFYSLPQANGTTAIGKTGNFSTRFPDMSFDVVEIMNVTPAGDIEHYYEFKNAGTAAIDDLHIIAMLDLELNGNDLTTVLADGSGNSYVHDKNITISNQAIANAVQYVGEYLYPSVSNAPTGSAGTIVLSLKDAAVYYFLNASNVLPNDVVEFAFKESFSKGAEETSQLIVNYLDQNGKVMWPADTFTGILGEYYELTPAQFHGYNLFQTLGNDSGVFTLNPQVVTYIYQLINNGGTTTPKPGNTASQMNTGKPAPVKAASAKKAGKDALPKMGEKDNAAAIIAGAVMIALVGFIFWKKEHKLS